MSEPANTDDLLKYDGPLVDQLARVDEAINKLAIQNYAASGAFG
jgi:hypothetical protein